MNISIFSKITNKNTTEKLIKEIFKADPTAKVSILSPRNEINSFMDVAIGINKVNLICDETLYGFGKVRKFLEENLTEIKRKNRSIGWYLQQYLKLAHCYTSEKDLLIIDGDTIFSSTFLEKYLKNPYLMRTNEKIAEYSVSSIFQKVSDSRYSYIANAGYFSPNILKKYIDNIDDWFINTVSKVIKNDSDFSEYQIMASLLKNEKKIIHEKNIKIFRRFELIDNVSWDNALIRYDAITIEQNHKVNMLNKLIAKYMYKVGYSW
ncbi:hypothetical protein [Polynucleobacter sphagniphilus]|jgi:hypothetical protein|uniref:Nucleotide-diphospho-sugar transferase domain-containing protein n=1 Tax=Polynucleobacter sphagniphilus TaxID=1743169 RepID=A0AA43MA02_9BURK|nr:hypothetical protein [Polynucleobacter sphagniphilus]MDH6504720.1 hypothetical protein [Polynucleobacter sphagniphilus]MDH6513454.1 hypothetical protein [Polynucleobacter sphagniphilus]